MADQVRRMLDMVDGEPAPEFVDGLRDRIFAVMANGAPVPLDNEENIVTITQQAPDVQPAPPGRHVVRWLSIAAAVVAVVAAGVLIAERGGDDEQPAGVPPPTALAVQASVEDTRLANVYFDGTHLWSAANGSTSLVRLDPGTGEIVDSLLLPSAAGSAQMRVLGGTMYVTTVDGVVQVNTDTFAMSKPLIGDPGEVTQVSPVGDVAWVVRIVPNEGWKLEKWDVGLTSMALSIDLGEVDVGGLQTVDGGAYLSVGDEGLRHYAPDGSMIGTVPGVGYAINLDSSPNGSLWAADFSNGELLAIDTDDDTVAGSVKIAADSLLGLWATDRSVWVASSADRTLHVVDPTTMVETASIATDGDPIAVTIADGVIWVAGDNWAQGFVPA